MANSKISALTAATTPVAGTETLPIVQGGVTKQVSIANLTAGRAVSAASLALTTPLPTTSGGTGLGSFSANQIFYASSTSAVGQSSDFTYTGSYASLGSAKSFRFYRGDNAIYTELYFTTGASGGFVINNVNGNQNSFQLGGVTQWEIPDANGNLVQKVASKGINFTANSSASGMTSQLLNYYEEGTWSPTISGATTTGTGTYNAAVGYYTRVGRLVTVQAYINLSNHTGTGDLRLSGLPFTQKNVSDLYGSITIGYLNNLALTANNVATGFGVFNTTYINVMQYPVGGGATNAVPMDTSFTIMYNYTYMV